MSIRRGFRKLAAKVHSRPSSPANVPSTPEPTLNQVSQASIPADTLTISTEAASSVSLTNPPAGDRPSVPSIVVVPASGDFPAAGAAAKSTKSQDCVIDNIALALDMAEKLAGFVKTVPFIAPAAGFLSQIVKTYKEVKATNDKRDALLAQITAITQDLCATILRMEATNHIDLIGRLRTDVETYTRLLGEASEFVVAYEGIGHLHRGLARTQLGSKFSNLQQGLDSFGARFRTNRLVDLSIQQSTIKETLDKVHDIAVEGKLERWLRSPPDMGHKQHDTQKLRKEGTGHWFLDGKFIEWQDNPGSLWIQGPSGAGKSVLSSTVIAKLINDQQLFKDFGKSAAVAFFYFDFKTKEGQMVETALRRIVLQLSAQTPFPYRALDRHYDLSKGQTLPSFEGLCQILEELLQELERTYIIFDALDECHDLEYGQLTDLITMLLQWTHTPLHLLITSQPRTIFTEKFTAIPPIFLGSDVTQDDIELFITAELLGNHKLKIWASRASEIVDQIVTKSSGMFRLAACLLVELSRCKRQDELGRTLQNLPNDLFGVYDRFLDRIRREDLVYVTGILRWIIFSAEDVDLTQLADAVTFDFSEQDHYTYVPSIRGDHLDVIHEWFEGLAIVSYWGGLELSHASVQDYFVSSHFTDKFGYDLRSGPSHTFIARSCIFYFFHFTEHPLNKETRPNYPLASYAAEYWCHHLLRSADRTALLPKAMHLLDDGSKQYIALNNIDPDKATNIPMQSPLQLCCKEGYIEGARYLLEKGVNVNAQGGQFGNALQAASVDGNLDVVCLLLENGADVNAEDGYYGSALQAACHQGHTDVVQLLLKNGANVNALGGEFGTALQAASIDGNPDVVHLLLEKGADVNAEGGKYATALQAACRQGNADVAQLLLQNGANVNAQGGQYGNALQAASLYGNPDVVHMLLGKGADVNAKGGEYGSALQAACWYSRMDTVRLLLQNGANVDAQCGRFGNALQAASIHGNLDVVRLLLEKGADVNAEGRLFGSALQAACYRGHADVAQLLLQNGANVNAQGRYFGNVLQAASADGNPDVVRLLLERGADVNAKGGEYGSALQAACRYGHADVARLLLQNGANVSAQSGEYGNALQAALVAGNPDVVCLLLEKEVDVNAEGGKYENALQAACYGGNTDVARLLLENGANANAQCGEYGNALQAASLAGNLDVVRLLLEKGADVNAKGGLFGSAPKAALAMDHTEIADLLRASGAYDSEPESESDSESESH
ncbi:ankyrin repeat-containing domain protein [Mycena galericulata]|nr:ankyrin repeat-containing domain protein [Mycena galericulata]